MPNISKGELEKSSYLCYTDKPDVTVGGPISVYNFTLTDGNPPVLSDGGFSYNDVKRGGFGYLHLISDADPDDYVESYVPLITLGHSVEDDTVTYSVGFTSGDGRSINFTSTDPDAIMVATLE